MDTNGELRPTGLAISAVFAGVGGLLDAFTYLGHSHTFANSMTGNLVLLGLNVVQRDWRPALQHVIALLSFVLGVSTARSMRKDERVTLGLEMAIIALVALMPSNTPNVFVTFCIAFAASLQVEAFRIVEGYPYSSTFTTGNLRTLVESICDWILQRRKSSAVAIGIFAAICGSFSAGAVAGAILTPILNNRTLWVVILVLGYPLRLLVGGQKQESTRPPVRIADV